MKTIKAIYTKTYEIAMLETPYGTYQVIYVNPCGEVVTGSALLDYNIASSVFNLALAMLESY